MAFDYFYGRGTEQFAFYQIPKVLITDDRFADISLEAKFLYSLMLDRRETVESIRTYGVMSPVIVRPDTASELQADRGL